MAREELEIYDVIIVGGGIVGAGILRENALHDVSTLLLDQADFNSQTSQGSSKMLHGGIRYLENLDFALVFEALKEKNLWLKLTPHISKEIPFLLPVYKDSKWPLFMMRAGLFIYDLLSLFKNSPHKVFNREKTLEKFPSLNSTGLTGAGLYYDGIVDDSKLGLECIYDALNNKKCHALNYKKVTNINGYDGNFKVTYQDVISKDENIVSCKKIVFATGPFTDQVLPQLKIPWEPVLLPSKGTHIWLKKNALPIREAIVLQTNDGRVIFVIPQRETILVGTTEIPLNPDDNFLNIKPTKDEIDYLLASLKTYFPNNIVKNSDILNSFSAVRPLVRAGTSSSKTSRNHKIFNPQAGIHVIVGGKYTTFRKMACDLNKQVYPELKIKHDKKLTLQPLRTTSIVKNPFEQNISLEDLKNIITNEHVRTKDDLLSRRLSLPSLEHIDDKVLKETLESFELESFRKPH